MTYEKALRILALRQEERIDFGLKRLREHLKRLGDPQGRIPAVLVAGTNGKGSVCALLASALQAAGYRTGLYTSPHLQEVSERIRVNGHPISPEEIGAAFSRVLDAEKDRLTFFELLTAAAFDHFDRSKVDIAVLEIGLGGRLDAVNCATNVLATLVTSIHFDHMQYLGNTLSLIAREKAGIFRPGVPAITGETAQEPVDAMEKAARSAGTRLEPAPAPLRVVKVLWEEGSQVMEGSGGERLTLGMLGKAQARNASLAHAALKTLAKSGFPVSLEAERTGFGRVRWPGRFDVRYVRAKGQGLRAKGAEGKVWILDGAHNPQAMGNFLDTLEASPWGKGPLPFVVGFLKDKDHGGMLELLKPRLGEVVVCPPPSPRALPGDELSRSIRRLRPEAAVTVCRDAGEAYALLKGRPVVVVCGSFYLVGAFLKSWELQTPDSHPMETTAA